MWNATGDVVTSRKATQLKSVASTRFDQSERAMDNAAMIILFKCEQLLKND